MGKYFSCCHFVAVNLCRILNKRREVVDKASHESQEHKFHLEDDFILLLLVLIVFSVFFVLMKEKSLEEIFYAGCQVTL